LPKEEKQDKSGRFIPVEDCIRIWLPGEEPDNGKYMECC